MPQLLQPFLHDLVTVLAAPTQVWSRRDGQVDGSGVQGLIHADIRVLSVIEVRVDGDEGEHLASGLDADGLHVSALLRRLSTIGPIGPDPVIRLDRHRRVRPGRLSEQLVISSMAHEPVEATVTVRLVADLCPMGTIRQGSAGSARAFSVVDGAASWGDAGVAARLLAPDAEIVVGIDDLELRWPVAIPARGEVRLGYEVEVSDTEGVVVAGSPVADLAGQIAATLELAGAAVDRDRRIRPWVEQSLSDLARLRMARPENPDEVFFAAGAPWYFTLFGRDSLLSARMMLAIDPSVAVGTLRTLARLQGTTTDVATAEEPGKIMHELRRAGSTFLPPLYYGTIDATPLWVCLLHDVWRTGSDAATVEELLPQLQAALTWLTTYGDADGDGFLEYLDASGRGLTNQGWKDSGDSVRFADGTIATGPVALCEVQGYAYEAAFGGAEILDAYGLEGGDKLRAWAGELAERFRRLFWVTARGRRFPALALDGEKRAVDSVSSNIGHLLGTGLLDADEERAVADLIGSPEMDSGLGLRTMSEREGGYSPLSYHCGSVWPHDTAIVIAGLVRAGLVAQAAGLVEGLITAAAAFDFRVPELYSGEGRPVPYPASCRPQAWSAAAVVPVAVALGQLG